ncbi:MAG: hypothetical protein U0166_20595 [Acidobacteriota bacterium]
MVRLPLLRCVLGSACCLVFVVAAFSVVVALLRSRRTYPGK